MTLAAFEFATAGRIRFGAGAARELGELAGALGRRALLITGRRGAPEISDDLTQAGIAVTRYQVNGEPTVPDALAAVQLGREAGVDLVVACGGGSAIDLGKAAAALLANPEDIYLFLEVVGRGQPLQKPPLPFVAVPTTAGTGSEVTRNAVLLDPGTRVKVSLRSPLMLPRLALVDPRLTLTLPPALTAATGMDALTQLLEPFVSLRANPLVDGLCREGLARVGWALPQAVRDGQDEKARSAMSLASLFGGLALANAGLGAVHGLAAPIGGMFAAPHGVVCAALLAPVTLANIAALRDAPAGEQVLERYAEAARLLSGGAARTADDLPGWLANFARDLGIPSLRTFGIPPADMPAIVEKALAASSMRANPVALTPQALEQVLEEAAW